ncbi:hypothetical protein ACHAXR_003622 [Thalassiosira sp. AJA248-18]
MVYTVKSADTDTGRRFISAVDSLLKDDLISAFANFFSSNDAAAKRVAFDCEGVNLSRIGSLELVSICFPALDVYLVDFGGKPCPKIVKSVKDLFESEKVNKIIHDCRMDCDALYHLHGIKVVNVHDTSCFHDVITGTEHKNLNDVLGYNGISLNSERDKSVYRTNPRFWSERPLTTKMIDWASSDVDKLFTLADKQLDRLPDASKPKALAKSTKYTCTARNMKVCTGLKVKSPGLFIGRGGQNIKSLSNRTGTHIYSDRGSKTGDSWFVFYESDASLDIVKRKMAM